MRRRHTKDSAHYFRRTFHTSEAKASGALAQPSTSTTSMLQALEQRQATPAMKAASPLLNTNCYRTGYFCRHHQIALSGLVPSSVVTRIRCNFGASPFPCSRSIPTRTGSSGSWIRRAGSRPDHALLRSAPSGLARMRNLTDGGSSRPGATRIACHRTPSWDCIVRIYTGDLRKW